MDKCTTCGRDISREDAWTVNGGTCAWCKVKELGKQVQKLEKALAQAGYDCFGEQCSECDKKYCLLHKDNKGFTSESGREEWAKSIDCLDGAKNWIETGIWKDGKQLFKEQC
jgi:hypothetical protein